jgi:hypothetical protein
MLLAGEHQLLKARARPSGFFDTQVSASRQTCPDENTTKTFPVVALIFSRIHHMS